VWLLPRMSPSVVYIILWNWSVHSGDTSLINQVLIHVFGVDRPVDLLVGSPMMLVIMANGFVGASFAMIILTAAVRSIPLSLFHAAKADGAGSFAILRHILLPALRWPITYVAIWQGLSLLVSFEYILLLTGGGPFQDTTVLALYIYRRAFASGQYGYGAALALFLIIPGIVFALFAWRYTNMRKLMRQPKIEVH
jgi:inositol-phosphate transport system permease protein